MYNLNENNNAGKCMCCLLQVFVWVCFCRLFVADCRKSCKVQGLCMKAAVVASVVCA